MGVGVKDRATSVEFIFFIQCRVFIKLSNHQEGVVEWDRSGFKHDGDIKF